MEKLYKVSEIARMLNVSTVAVRKWIRAGKLNAKRVGKLWMIPESELKNFLGEKPSEVRVVIYARSSHKQKKDGNLDRQVERLKMYCSAKGYRVIDVITDIASGLKEDRSGLQKLFEIVVNEVWIRVSKEMLRIPGSENRGCGRIGEGIHGGARRRLRIHNHGLRCQNLWQALAEVQEDKKVVEEVVSDS